MDLGDLFCGLIDVAFDWKSAAKFFLIAGGLFLLIAGYTDRLSPIPGWVGMASGVVLTLGSVAWIAWDLMHRREPPWY